jgi:hypothetical protein
MILTSTAERASMTDEDRGGSGEPSGGDDEIAKLVDAVDAVGDPDGRGDDQPGDGTDTDAAAATAPDDGAPARTGATGATRDTGPAEDERDGTAAEDALDGDAAEELLEELAEGESVDGGLAADDADDELDTDPRAERFGYAAGLIVTVLLGVMLFVGPWRWFNVDLGAGLVPVEARDDPQENIAAVGAVAISLVGFLVGGVYRMTTDDRPGDYRSAIAVNTIVVQLLVALVVYLLFLLGVVVAGLLDGSVVGAVVLLAVGLVYLVFFTFFEFVGMSIYVGIPAWIGVFVGDLFGSVLE